MADEFCLEMPDFHVTFMDLLHAVNLRHGTDGFTSPPKEVVLRILFALKNPTASVGFEPANLGTKGQQAASRLLKPLTVTEYWKADREVYCDVRGRREWPRVMFSDGLNTGSVAVKHSVLLFRSSDSASGWLVSERRNYYSCLLTDIKII